MVVILRADDGDVRQARLRQQGFRIRKQADGGAFLLRGKVPHGFRAFLHGVRRRGNAVTVLPFHGQLHVGPGAGTAADAGEGESFLSRHECDRRGGRFKECRI